MGVKRRTKHFDTSFLGAEKERVAAEIAEKERVAAVQAEKERVAAEIAEKERLAAVKAEADRRSKNAKSKGASCAKTIKAHLAAEEGVRRFQIKGQERQIRKCKTKIANLNGNLTNTRLNLATPPALRETNAMRVNN